MIINHIRNQIYQLQKIKLSTGKIFYSSREPGEVNFLGPVVQKAVNANLGLNLPNLGLNFNLRLLCVVQS